MSNAIEVHQGSPFEPQNLQQAMELARMLSGSGLLPRALQGKPADTLVIMLKGHELGLSPMQAISGISVIQGKAVVEAATMVGLCLRRRDVCEFFRLVSGDDRIATFETKRINSERVTMSFTIDEAKRAGLLGKDNWRNYPAAMLRARASSGLARAVYPDLTAGMYDPDEVAAPPVNSRVATEVRPVAFEEVKEPTIEPDEVAKPPPPVSGDVPEFQRPEFVDDSPEQKLHIKIGMFKLATFPSGSRKGQFLESADIPFLSKTLDHMAKAENKTARDVLFSEALQYWIDAKSATDDYSAEDIAKAQGQEMP